MKIKFMVSLILAVLFVTGCVKKEEEAKPKEDNTEVQEKEQKEEEKSMKEEGLTEEEKEAVAKAKKVIQLNLEYAEKEDLEKYLSTLNTKDMDLERESSKYVFEELDLKYNIVGEIDAVEISSDLSKIKLKVTQETIGKSKDGNFKSNRLVATHTLSLIEGEYKITETIIDEGSFEYLE